MRTMFRTKPVYAEILKRCAEELPCYPVRPEHFIWKMKHNKGCISMLMGGKRTRKDWNGRTRSSSRWETA